MGPTIRHLHTYFLFPFSVDKEAVLEDHKAFWPKRKTWFDGLDTWIDYQSRHDHSPVVAKLGAWRRAAYTRFDMESEAYQTMVFFHPFVRRVFFDAHDPAIGREREESLLNCYEIPVEGKQVLLRATDSRGRTGEVHVTDLRLLIFANGIGILSIGVEAFDVSASQALWINEMLRKVYPSSARQIREGRIPRTLELVRREGEEEIPILFENFADGELVNFHARLAATITGLLYFAEYSKHEYAAVLDERMLVYTYAAIDSGAVPPDFGSSEQFEVLLSRFLYVDRHGDDFRYDRGFTKKLMRRQIYTRWAHQGTHYGFTSYSSITVTIGLFDCDEHKLREGFLIHRMFSTRYYLMCVIALFYRATLLDFAERAALVSKRLYFDQSDAKLTAESIHIANRLRGDFLHFTNYWLFDELANKDEEMEHFLLQSRQYRLNVMQRQTEEEIEKLNSSLNEYYQIQSAQAVNRLAVSSMALGAGAVVTGYFGMNFGREFASWFFEPNGSTSDLLHYGMIIGVTVFAVAALVFSFVLIAGNWRDYRILLTSGRRLEEPELQSLRRASAPAPKMKRENWILRRRVNAQRQRQSSATS